VAGAYTLLSKHYFRPVLFCLCVFAISALAIADDIPLINYPKDDSVPADTWPAEIDKSQPHVVRAPLGGGHGLVSLLVTIDATGKVTDTTVQYTSCDPASDQAASESVRKWHFIPAKRGNTPIASRRYVAVSFGPELTCPNSFPAYRPDSEPPAKKCDIGAVSKIYGNRKWLVSACDDGHDVLIVSTTNHGLPFFLFHWENGSYHLLGGDSDPVSLELKKFTEADIERLRTEAEASAHSETSTTQPTTSTPSTTTPSTRPPINGLGQIASGPACAIPTGAVRAGTEERTLLEFHLDANGQIVDTTVIDSSGNTILNDAALRCFREWRVDARKAMGIGRLRAHIFWTLPFLTTAEEAKSLGIIVGTFSVSRLQTCESFYPADSKAAGATLVEFKITAAGTISDARVIESSGHAELDDAAISCVQHLRYQPALQNGVAVDFIQKMKVVWSPK
jgi:TonB family protein